MLHQSDIQPVEAQPQIVHLFEETEHEKEHKLYKKSRTESGKKQRNLLKYPVLPPCENCKFKCNRVLREHERAIIREQFWGLSDAGRQLFYDSYVVLKKPHLITRNPVSEKMAKSNSREYLLPSRNGTKQRVCKTMFLGTLGLRSDSRIQRWAENRFHASDFCYLKDRRGQYDRHTSREVKQRIHDHIESYNPQYSHYGQMHAPLRRYLEPLLSRRKMHGDYIAEFGRVSYALFCKVFQECRITIGTTRIDSCETCESAKLHKHNIVQNAFYCCDCAKYSNHHQFAKVAREEYQAEQGIQTPNNTIVFATDLQKVLLLPMMNVKASFFTRKLVCFNETFACLSGAKDICVMWHEAIAGRKAADIASTFVKVIQHYSTEYENFRFWADNCAAQNKNWTLFTALVQAANSINNVQTITIKYLEHGHTYMKADAVHGIIGRKIRKSQCLFEFRDLLQLVDKASYSMHAMELHLEDILKWTPKCNRRVGLPKLHNVRVAEFRRGHRSLYWKSRFTHTEFQQADFFPEFMPLELPESTATERGVNKDKKAIILSTLCPLMPEDKRHFWSALPVSDMPDLLTSYEWIASPFVLFKFNDNSSSKEIYDVIFIYIVVCILVWLR